MYLEYFKIFGIEKYEMRLRINDEEKLGDKYVDEPELWIKTENLVREALIEGGLNFTEIPGEAAYGPKIFVLNFGVQLVENLHWQQIRLILLFRQDLICHILINQINHKFRYVFIESFRNK